MNTRHAVEDARRILTVAEVARRLRCSKAHVYNVINGHVQGVSRLVRRSTLEAWERQNEDQSEVLT